MFPNIWTGTDEHNRERAGKFAELLQEKFPDRPVFSSRYRAGGLVMQGKDGSKVQVKRDILDEQRCYAFCGIARPEGFSNTLEQLGLEPVAFQVLADHHAYHEKEVQQLVSQAAKEAATCFLCTEKDLVKLRAFDLGLPLYAVSMEVDSEPALGRFVLNHLSK